MKIVRPPASQKRTPVASPPQAPPSPPTRVAYEAYSLPTPPSAVMASALQKQFPILADLPIPNDGTPYFQENFAQLTTQQQSDLATIFKTCGPNAVRVFSSSPLATSALTAWTDSGDHTPLDHLLELVTASPLAIPESLRKELITELMDEAINPAHISQDPASFKCGAASAYFEAMYNNPAVAVGLVVQIAMGTPPEPLQKLNWYLPAPRSVSTVSEWLVEATLMTYGASQGALSGAYDAEYDRWTLDKFYDGTQSPYTKYVYRTLGGDTGQGDKGTKFTGLFPNQEYAIQQFISGIRAGSGVETAASIDVDKRADELSTLALAAQQRKLPTIDLGPYVGTDTRFPGFGHWVAVVTPEMFGFTPDKLGLTFDSADNVYKKDGVKGVVVYDTIPGNNAWYDLVGEGSILPTRLVPADDSDNTYGDVMFIPLDWLQTPNK